MEKTAIFSLLVLLLGLVVGAVNAGDTDSYMEPSYDKECAINYFDQLPNDAIAVIFGFDLPYWQLIRVCLRWKKVFRSNIKYLNYGLLPSGNAGLNIDNIRQLKGVFDNITRVMISGVSNLSDEILDELALNFPRINDIYIFNSRHISDDGLKNFKKIKRLRLVSNRKITPQEISHMHGIVEFAANGNDNFDDESLVLFSNAIKLSFSGFNNISDDGLAYLKNVEDICLQSVPITDRGLAYLTKVKRLDINLCANITGEFLQYTPHIEDISLHNCYQFQEENLKFVNNIKKIDLINCRITERIFEFISSAKKIILGGREQSFPCDSFKAIEDIKAIYIFESPWLNDGHLKWLAGAEHVLIDECENITERGLDYLSDVRSLNFYSSKFSINRKIRHK